MTTTDTGAFPRVDSRVPAEAGKRRAFAVISHPDAGKSTLTEALALHASAITQAGAVHGKAGRRGVTSDWMALERARGISITSAALRFDYRDTVLNLLDTPGHADFSEDTYRVLSAVDCAIMLLDSAKGLEPQTLKLFDVCRARAVPVITFVNKWDRPGRSPLELLDEIEQRIGLHPAPLNWPVGVAGDFRGLIERETGEYTIFTRTPGGADRALESVLDPGAAAARDGDAYETAVEELALLDEVYGPDVDMPAFQAGVSSPVLFGAALPNFGVRRLLDAVTALAPPPSPREDVKGAPRAIESPFSGLVFKVQANMDPAHRDRVAFVRVCSGRFERGMVLTHAATGRPFATKYAQSMFGQDRETVDVAYPGDVIGLVNAAALRPGDTLYSEPPVEFPPIPSFAPEHFGVVRCSDAGKHKQFRRGIEQLDTEGVVQVLSSDLRGDQAPVLAAVGPLQFDVVLHRLEHEFGARAGLDHLDYTLARRTDAASAEALRGQRAVEVLTRRLDGALLALFADKWRLGQVQRENPDLLLEPLLADAA
ncbi:MAG: peptide chain release factor 3 [Streptosporangiaceae bacterium]|nr:peptide chain release factor 3 [Streptosporangiaceae bacterium]